MPQVTKPSWRCSMSADREPKEASLRPIDLVGNHRPPPGDFDARRLEDKVPMDGVALGDDIARVALFLLSDESRWMTGAILPSDGGQHVSSRTSATRFEGWAEMGLES